jgi:hypothetical protein
MHMRRHVNRQSVRAAAAITALLGGLAGLAVGCALDQSIPCVGDDNCPTGARCEATLCTYEPAAPSSATPGEPGVTGDTWIPGEPNLGAPAEGADAPDDGEPTPDVDSPDTGASDTPDPAPAGTAPRVSDVFAELTSGSTGVLTLDIIEPDGDALTITVDAGHTQFAQDGAALRWDLSDGWYGTERRTITVSDRDGSATASLDLVVTPGDLSPFAGAAEPVALRVDVPPQGGGFALEVPIWIDADELETANASVAPNRLAIVDARSGAVLPHDVEAWRVDGGVIWVRVPEAGALRHLRLYASDAVVNAPDGQRVWQDRAAVYHLSDVGQAANAAIGDPVGQIIGAEDTTGLIDRGLRLDGLNDSVDLGDNLSLLSDTDAFTFSAWIQPQWLLDDNFDVRYGGVLFAISTASSERDSRVQVELTDFGALQVWARSDDDERPWIVEGPDHVGLTLDWHHVAARVDFAGKTIDVWLDGISQDLINLPSSDGNERAPGFASDRTDASPSMNGALGSQDDGSRSHYYGLLDEVRVSRQLLPVARLQAEANDPRLQISSAHASGTASRSGLASPSFVLPDVTLPDGESTLVFVRTDADARVARVRAPGRDLVPLSRSETVDGGLEVWLGNARAGGVGDVVIELDRDGPVSASLVSVADDVSGAPVAIRALSGQGDAVSASHELDGWRGTSFVALASVAPVAASAELIGQTEGLHVLQATHRGGSAQLDATLGSAGEWTALVVEVR